MRAISKTLFLLIEVPLTLFAGIFALRSPLPFITAVLPARLHPALTSINGEVTEIISALVGMYGLVLVILALAEALILLVRDQAQSKNCLLLPMLVGDIIHVVVYWKLWFPIAPTLHDIQAFGSHEWASIASNLILVLVCAFLRLAFMRSNTKLSVAKAQAAKKRA
jgi:hypothetical protein